MIDLKNTKKKKFKKKLLSMLNLSQILKRYETQLFKFVSRQHLLF